jgi:hypothetical protein
MAASIFDHPWVLLIIAAVALLRWLIEKGKGESQNTETPTPPPNQPIARGSETQTEEERIRKFLEALGQPAGTTPPKVAPRRRQVEPRIFPKLPRLTTAPPPLPQAPVAQASTQPPMPIKPATQRLPTALEPDFEVYEVARQTSSEPPPENRRATPLAARVKLGTPQDLRTAIVLREIFGPPRSLQPVDLTSSSQIPR